MVVNGQVAVRPMMYLAVTYDHRIIDGREAVQFLVTIKEASRTRAGCCSAFANHRRAARGPPAHRPHAAIAGMRLRQSQRLEPVQQRVARAAEARRTPGACPASPKCQRIASLGRPVRPPPQASCAWPLAPRPGIPNSHSGAVRHLLAALLPRAFLKVGHLLAPRSCSRKSVYGAIAPRACELCRRQQHHRQPAGCATRRSRCRRTAGRADGISVRRCRRPGNCARAHIGDHRVDQLRARLRGPAASAVPGSQLRQPCSHRSRARLRSAHFPRERLGRLIAHRY